MGYAVSCSHCSGSRREPVRGLQVKMAKQGGRLMRLFNNREQIAKSVIGFTAPRAARAWQVAKVELLPPSPAEIPQITKEASNLWRGLWTKKFLNTSVKEATLNAAVTLEVAMWFFIGEIIGKGSIIGYKIPGTVHYHEGF